MTSSLLPQELRMLRYLQEQAVAQARKALLEPLDPPASALWAEVELRVCNSPAADPDALQYNPGHQGVTTGHLRRMVIAQHSRHVLLNRVPESGLSCYAVNSPVNVDEMIADTQVAPVLKECARFSLAVTRTATGYAMSVELAPADTADASHDLTHACAAPDVRTACRGALHWIYGGYPLTDLPLRVRSSVVHQSNTVPPPTTQVVQQHTHHQGESAEYSWIRRKTGWWCRWVLAYVASGVYLLVVLGAAAYSWTHGGVYLEEVLAIVKGCVLAAVSGTAFKYMGVWLMEGLPGVAKELT